MCGGRGQTLKSMACSSSACVGELGLIVEVCQRRRDVCPEAPRLHQLVGVGLDQNDVRRPPENGGLDGAFPTPSPQRERRHANGPLGGAFLIPRPLAVDPYLEESSKMGSCRVSAFRVLGSCLSLA